MSAAWCSCLWHTLPGVRIRQCYASLNISGWVLHLQQIMTYDFHLILVFQSIIYYSEVMLVQVYIVLYLVQAYCGPTMTIIWCRNTNWWPKKRYFNISLFVQCMWWHFWFFYVYILFRVGYCSTNMLNITDFTGNVSLWLQWWTQTNNITRFFDSACFRD